ncbi:MAG: hypothetical protein HC770_06975 [Pseudanabaena sp. CRU_2_10]|nr:hypothetical protein [Pseudanabaena sp. CRU_2_10]
MKQLISLCTTLTLMGSVTLAPHPIYAQSVTKQNPSVRKTSVQAATLPKLQEGSLVRGSTPIPIYVINAGRRRLIPNTATFDALGYKLENVVQLSEQQLKAIPELPPVLLKRNSQFKDGSLVKDDSDRVYLIALGGRRLIPDAKTFEALGYQRKNVQKISNRELKSIPEYAPLPISTIDFKDGTLIKGSLPAVYVISDNKRRLIPDEATFNASGYKWENIRTISDRALNAIPELPPLSARIVFKDGTLLKGSRAAIYVISSGRRRLIPNGQTFDALGYRWENVQQISDSQLESIPEMPPLPSY